MGIQSCMTDVEGAAASAYDIYNQIKSGSPDFSKIIQDAQTIMSDVTAAEADCKLKKLIKPKLYGAEGTCEEDIEKLAADATDLFHSISGGNWAKALEDVAALKADIT